MWWAYEVVHSVSLDWMRFRVECLVVVLTRTSSRVQGVIEYRCRLCQIRIF